MQCVVQDRAGQTGDTRARCHDDVVSAKFCLGMAKRFPYVTLDTVACHRRARGLAGYGQTKPGMIAVIGHSQYGQPAIACLAAAVPEYLPVFGWPGESRLPGKTRQAGTQGGIRRTAAPDPWHDVP